MCDKKNMIELRDSWHMCFARVLIL